MESQHPQICSDRLARTHREWDMRLEGASGRTLSAVHPAPDRKLHQGKQPGVSGNTVKLGSLNEVVRWMLGLWPGGVVGTFDVPLGHLAFDDAGRRAAAAGGVEPADEPLEEEQPAGAVATVLVRGGKRPGGRWSGG